MGRKQAQAIFAALIAWPALAQDYNPVPIPGQIIGSPETMTPLNGGDDSTRLVQLGFPFEYFGQTFTQAWVSSNGFVSFGDIGHLCCNGTPIEQAPRNAIYGLWTDLISGGNPYFRTNANEAVFGWYATQEYGSGLPNTIEIALFPDGKVQWNYGDVNNQWHLVTAGLTGPTMADSISIFYGQNVNLLDNTSYIAGVPSAPPPEPEPEPPFTPVDAAPSVIESPISQQEQVEEQQAEQAVQEVIAEQEAVATEVQDEAVATESTAQEAQSEQEAQETVEAVSEAVETAVEAGTEAEAVADNERLSPDEVAALAAESQSEQSSGDAQQSDQLAVETIAVEQAQTEQQVQEQSSSESQQGGQESQQAAQSTSEQANSNEARQIQSQDKSLNQSEAAPDMRRERFDPDVALDPIKAADAVVQASMGGNQDVSSVGTGKADSNVQFFQLEAAEDADTFQRERVIPVSVADAATVALNNAERERVIGEQTTTETPAGTYDILIVDGPTFMPTPTTGMGDVSSPAGQAQQMELLGMNGMQSEMASGQPSDIGDINSGDKETMTQLAALPPGYSGYTQLRLPDAPFYEPRDIYRGRRIPDANMALYRMMSGQDAKWAEMVGDQYE